MLTLGLIILSLGFIGCSAGLGKLREIQERRDAARDLASRPALNDRRTCRRVNPARTRTD